MSANKETTEKTSKHPNKQISKKNKQTTKNTNCPYMAFINRLLGGGPSVSLAVKDAASKQSNIRQHCQHQHLLSSLLSLQFRRHKGSGRGSGFYRHPGSPPPPFPHPSRHSSSSSDKPGGRFPIDTGSGSEQRSFAELHFFSAGRTYESYPLSPGKGGSGFARPQQQAAVQQTSQILKPQQVRK